MPIVNLDGQNIFYDALGSGDPILLMHGWTQVGRDLGNVARALAADYQVILPDMPGYGRSVPPLRNFTPNFYQRDALLMGALIKSLGLSKVHIMGFSDGGEVALLMGILWPDLCRSIVAWGAIGSYGPELRSYARRNTLKMKVTDEMRGKHPGQEVKRWPRQWVEAISTIVERGGDLSLKRASQIACPVMLILGDQDALNPVAAGQRFIDAVSAKKRFEVFPGVGHPVHNEQPEAFMAVVREFLKDV